MLAMAFRLAIGMAMTAGGIGGHVAKGDIPLGMAAATIVQALDMLS